MSAKVVPFPRRLTPLQSLTDIVGTPPPQFHCSPGPPTPEKWAEFIMVNLAIDGFMVVPIPERKP